MQKTQKHTKKQKTQKEQDCILGGIRKQEGNRPGLKEAQHLLAGIPQISVGKTGLVPSG